MKKFPNDFAFGVATSAYQIEGAGGKSLSIWDKFSKIPGNIRDGSNGDVACDHYNRWKQDIDLMQKLGIKNYRFSVAWTRNNLDFYDHLTDKLLESGITPWVTLYHFDLPQILEDKGGWPNRETANHFENYSDIVSRRLGDRVKNWITINEPSVEGHDGYIKGSHAPGRRDLKDGLSAIHTMLIAHGKAVSVIRENVPDAQVGLALHLQAIYPDSESSTADQQAALRQDGYQNRWFLDPLFKAQYPPDMVKVFGEQNIPEIKPGDFKTIGIPINYLGINYYFPLFVKDDPEDLLLKVRSIDYPDMEHTDMGWLVYPKGLSDTLRRVSVEYGNPNLYVTENGAAFPDKLIGGHIKDVRRTNYIVKHLKECLVAIREGIPLKGYFLWSLLDNFEWQEGYTKRFGITYIDFVTQQRTIKQSGYRYKEIIINNSLKIIA